jgi:hypothetical protein
MNVFGVSGTASVAVNQAMADALFTAIKAGFTSSGMQALCVDDCVMTGVGIRSVNNPNLPEFIGAGASIAGSDAAGDMMPRSVACVITLRTALVGKSYRGRVYIGGFNEAQNAGLGAIVAAASTAADTFVTSIANALIAQGLHLAVLSPALPERQTKGGLTLPAKPAFATDVISHSQRNAAWGSQRGRTHRA